MSPTRMSRIESAIRVVLSFNQAFNRHDIEGMMACVSDDCLLESSIPTFNGAVYSGKAALKAFFQEFLRVSPQAHIDIDEIFGAGLRCVTRWTYSWVDAKGRKGLVRGADIFQVKNGLICEVLSYVKGVSESL